MTSEEFDKLKPNKAQLDDAVIMERSDVNRAFNMLLYTPEFKQNNKEIQIFLDNLKAFMDANPDTKKDKDILHDFLVSKFNVHIVHDSFEHTNKKVFHFLSEVINRKDFDHFCKLAIMKINLDKLPV